MEWRRILKLLTLHAKNVERKGAVVEIALDGCLRCGGLFSHGVEPDERHIKTIGEFQEFIAGICKLFHSEYVVLLSRSAFPDNVIAEFDDVEGRYPASDLSLWDCSKLPKVEGVGWKYSKELM